MAPSAIVSTTFWRLILQLRDPEDLKGKRIGVSQLGSSTDFIARVAGSTAGLILRRTCRSSALAARETAGPRSPPDRFSQRVSISVYLKGAQAGYQRLSIFSKEDFRVHRFWTGDHRSFIGRRERQLLNFMRGLADGMDYYRDEKNKEPGHKFLGEYYRSNNCGRAGRNPEDYSQVTPGLPIVRLRHWENVIGHDKTSPAMKLNVSELFGFIFS